MASPFSSTAHLVSVPAARGAGHCPVLRKAVLLRSGIGPRCSPATRAAWDDSRGHSHHRILPMTGQEQLYVQKAVTTFLNLLAPASAPRSRTAQRRAPGPGPVGVHRRSAGSPPRRQAIYLALGGRQALQRHTSLFHSAQEPSSFAGAVSSAPGKYDRFAYELRA